ncbi:MAG: hypothetical protein JJE39_06090 [Vicinamibacteria bacterium]|nr:hypothetical protein [Vicinamibacteria bacterium]
MDRGNRRGPAWFNDQRKRERMHPIEKVGAQLRSMMPFLDPVAVSPEEGATDSKPVEMAAVGAR